MRFERYAGLTYRTDTDFATTAVTLGANTGLEPYFCLAWIPLILFLVPPN